MLIFAGAAPYTMDGELPGGRNEFIHWLQDVRDQRGILRNYTKYDNEIRTGRNVKQLVLRALQIARSAPAGPVYLVGPREVMEEQVEPYVLEPGRYTPVAPMALAPEVTAEIATALARARKPLVITSYLGSNPAAVGELVQLADTLAVPVIEASPNHVNFPDTHPMHHGYHWHTAAQNPLLAEADVILVADSDVPWIPAVNRPADDAVIYCIDSDPVKEQLPLWHVPARRFAAADSRVALAQISAFIREHGLAAEELVAARRAENTAIHDAQRAEWAAHEQPRDGVHHPRVPHRVRPGRPGRRGRSPAGRGPPDQRAVGARSRSAPLRPGMIAATSPSSLGWGWVIGAKLAVPDRSGRLPIGDGATFSGLPSAV